MGKTFIGTLKAEMLRDGCFASHQDAAHELFAFIEGYYNTRRLPSRLDPKGLASHRGRSRLSGRLQIQGPLLCRLTGHHPAC